jgi:PTH1 family peptidyl-tRNA hydrolase
MGTWLVAGLGNPGDRYARTRHNAGSMVVDLLADRASEKLKKARFVSADAADFTDRDSGDRVVLARSHQFMNVSGPSYASLARKHKVDASHVIAVHDEIDLPFGALKLKTGGSTAGHHGLDSLAQALGTKDFHRVRIGVGRPPGRQDPADYVLDPFAKREQHDAAVLIEEAADAVLSLIRDGLEPTQDRFNRAGPRA